MKKINAKFAWVCFSVAIAAFLPACSQKQNESTPAAAEKKPSVEINPKHVAFVQNIIFDDYVAALNGDDSDVKHERALRTFNITQAVDAKKLAGDYNENEVAADQKYKKKGAYILVSGTVSGISKDYKGDPYVSLKGKDMFQDVQARFGDNDQNTLATLKKGQKVAFVCEVSHKIVTQVMLRECATVETHTNALRSKGFDQSVLDVMQGKLKASKEVAESIAAFYLLVQLLPNDSSCFLRIDSACEKQLSELTKSPQAPEFKDKFNELVAAWSK